MKRDKTIEEELKELAPFLATLERTNLLKVPEGYFEENEKKLVEMALIEGKVKKLREMSKEMPLEAIPAGYFENLPSAVLNRIQGNHELKIIPIQRSFIWKQWLQVAAAVAAIVIMALPLLQNNLNTKSESIDTALQKVSDDEINSYLSQSTIYMSDEELAKHISDAKLEQATVKIITDHTGKLDESTIDLSQVDINDIQNL